MSPILEILVPLGIFLAIILVVIIFNTILLKIGIKAVRGEKTRFGTVFITSMLLVVISGIISFGVNLIIPGNLYIGSAVSLVFNLFIIKARHRTTLLGAFAALIIYVIVTVVLILVLSILFAGTLGAILALIGL